MAICSFVTQNRRLNRSASLGKLDLKAGTSAGQSYFGNLDLDFCDMPLKEDIQPSHPQMNITKRRFQYVPCYYSFFLCSLTFQMTMKGGKLARLLLSVVALEILFFTGSDAVPEVGCSSARPSFPSWVNNWQQNFGVRCRTSKKSFYQSLRLTYILFLLRLSFHLLLQHAH